MDGLRRDDNPGPSDAGPLVPKRDGNPGPTDPDPKVIDRTEFLTEARERFQQGVDYDQDNRNAALEDLRFLTGEQWDPAVVKVRAGRPCLTINRLPQFVAQVVGDIRLNQPAIRVRPAEDGDVEVAETRQGLIRGIEYASKAQRVYASAGQSQVSCGLGHFRVKLEYASDDVFDQDIRIRSIPDPFAVVWDPMATEPTGADAEWCFVVDEIDRKTFEAAWPDAQSSDLTVGEAQGWSTKDTVRVTEYWRMQETTRTLAAMPDGFVVDVTDQPELAEQAVRTRQVTRRSAVMELITGAAVLSTQAYELPISRLPIFRVPGWEMHIRDKRVRWGLVRFAKDPQRLMNYDRSVFAETMGLAPKAQWIASSEAIEGIEDDFRSAHRSGDPLLVYNTGAEKPQRVDPPAFPAGLAQSAAMHAQDMKDVTGLHDASLGAQSNETSGKAIMARDRQGDVATYIYPDNLKDAIGECGRVVNELIPVVYDTARTIRVLGDDGKAEQKRINDPNTEGSIDLLIGKYDVVVESGPSYSTKRVEAAESMMAFVQAVPTAGAVAGDLIAKAQDWPMADEIAKRLVKTLPPGIREPEEGEEPEQPPPPDPMQQQQAQMAMQAGQLDLRLKAAQAEKAEADARRAEAEAFKAEMEVQLAQAGSMIGQMAPPPFEQPAPAAPGF